MSRREPCAACDECCEECARLCAEDANPCECESCVAARATPNERHQRRTKPVTVAARISAAVAAEREEITKLVEKRGLTVPELAASIRARGDK